jgi:hypothetical protein
MPETIAHLATCRRLYNYIDGFTPVWTDSTDLCTMAHSMHYDPDDRLQGKIAVPRPINFLLDLLGNYFNIAATGGAAGPRDDKLSMLLVNTVAETYQTASQRAAAGSAPPCMAVPMLHSHCTRW